MHYFFLRSPFLPVVVALAALMPSASAQTSAAPFAADRAALLRGVDAIQAPGALAGTLTLLDDANDFPVIAGERGGDQIPVVAAARAGKGRVFVYAHNGFLSAESLRIAGTARLLVNAASWAAARAPGGPVRVGLLDQADAGAPLTAAGYAVTPISAGDLPAALDRVDVLVSNPDALADPARIAAVQSWVRKGGGLITYGVGWGWQQLNPTRRLSTDAPFNRLLVPLTGIGCNAGTVGDLGARFPADASLAGSGSAGASLALLERYAAGGAAIPPAQTAAAGRSLIAAVDVLPDDDTRFLPRLKGLLAKYGTGPFSGVVPAKYSPVTEADPIARLAAAFEARALAADAADQIRAHPSAPAFPGSVPAEAPRVAARTFDVDTAVPDWHSTGLYAAPGEMITVTIPPDAARAGLGIRIGAHTDSLWNNDSWARFPEISVARKIIGTTLRLASAFGGTIYVTVPEKGARGTVPVTIAGAVAQPYFVKGKTSLADWNATLRKTPAPWAELQGDKIILTVPAFAVRNLQNPEALMTYWDQVADAAADLYGIPRERKRPERYCVDIQISAGYMHSGYPIMTFDDVAETFVNLRTLRGTDGLKTWGFYHELGHNHQQPDWTWEGCGEVTNNLLSLYGDETFNAVQPDYVHSHPAIAPDERHKRLVAYLAKGASFAGLNSDPFLTLTMFIQLRQAFGWDPYKNVFHQYTTLSPAEHPKSEIEKHDQFMVRFARVVGRNLGPFFTAWGLPTTDAARQSLAGLPAWTPPDWPTAAEIAAARVQPGR